MRSISGRAAGQVQHSKRSPVSTIRSTAVEVTRFCTNSVGAAEREQPTFAWPLERPRLADSGV